LTLLVRDAKTRKSFVVLRHDAQITANSGNSTIQGATDEIQPGPAAGAKTGPTTNEPNDSNNSLRGRYGKKIQRQKNGRAIFAYNRRFICPPFFCHMFSQPDDEQKDLT
jgi:hypothetical protein